MKVALDQHNLIAIVRDSDQQPAFHAGYLVLMMLAAALLHLGAFALLLMVTCMTDAVHLYQHCRMSLVRALGMALRRQILNVALLAGALVVAVFLNGALPALGVLSGLAQSSVTIVRGLALLIVKMKVLHDALLMMVHGHPRQHLSRNWSPSELLCLFCICIAAVLLVLSPSLLAVSVVHVWSMLRIELLPWSV